MARANLNIHSDLCSRFLLAQETKSIRILKVRIREEDIVLESTIDKSGDVITDFSTILLDNVEDDFACFLLFCLTDDTSSAQAWAIVTWVPDNCRVRDKMLYSSSKEDLKRNLGLSYFKSEYTVSTKEELTWEVFQESLKREFSSDILTESERLVLEEKVNISPAL